MSPRSLTRRTFGALAGAAAASVAAGSKVEAAGAPLTREALSGALAALGFRSGESVRIGVGSYRLENVHVGQVGSVFLVSFKADPQ